MFEMNLISEALVGMDEDRVLELVKNALDEGMAASDILQDGLIGGMNTVGEKMESGDMFIPEVLQSAKAMSSAVEILKPFLGEGGVHAVGTVLIGTVKGDLHDIGKNLLVMMLESAGFEVNDLGVDVSPEKFVEVIEASNPDLVAFSALLTTTMNMMRETIEAIKMKGQRDRVKILVGGAPVTQTFADDIGADAYAADAGSALRIAKDLLQ